MKVITSRKFAITSALLIARNNAAATRLGNKSSNNFVPSAAMENERILQNFDNVSFKTSIWERPPPAPALCLFTQEYLGNHWVIIPDILSVAV